MEEVRQDAEAAAWTQVSGEDVGYRAGEGFIGLGDRGTSPGPGREGLGGEVVAVEDERGGAPDAVPPGGEDLGARGFLGGEERDYLAEEIVGEDADAVDAAFFATSIRLRPFLDWGCRSGIGRLRGLRRPRRGLTSC